jgi:hypothetical protein
VVNPAVARRRRSSLPLEICGMSHNVTEDEAIHPDRAAEAESKVGQAVGEDIEALQRPKSGATDRPRRER